MVTLTIKSTDVVTTIEGVPVRLWEGVSSDGIPCKVFVHRIAVALEQDQRAFEEDLGPQREPVVGRFLDLRHVL